MSILNMVQMELDSRSLFELARRRSLPIRELDLGYITHCYLSELFGEFAPTPFSLAKQRGGGVTVLGYTEQSAEQLRAHADMYAEPLIHRGSRWERFAGKELPSAWKSGMQLGFEVRVCPVVRKSAGGDRHKKGAEVDVFLDRCWEAGEGAPVDRGEVYLEWLRSQFERHGGARVLAGGLHAFQRQRLVRRTQGGERKSVVAERPDAIIRGRLEVTDDAAFQALLRRGVGRHRAFGFGMLLLRRAESEC